MRPDLIAMTAAPLDECARREARLRQAILTKPPGALGRLEELAIQFAAMQGTPFPNVDKVHIAVFAADHGVVAEGVSAFPQAVTTEMVRNFARGGAAINVLAQALSVTLEVINLGTVLDPGPLPGVVDDRLGPGTANLAREAAMSPEQVIGALEVGRRSVERARKLGVQLFIGGDMGIGNTTSAAALACALLNEAPERLAGPGTGLDAAGVARKAAVIRRALDLHGEYLTNPWEALGRLGGFEIAALAGACIAAARAGLPLLVDGFISSVAALVAMRLNPGTRDWLIFSHASAEPGHACVLQAMNAKPLLDLGMRLGEGSGAAVAVPLLRLACALHNGMATFAEAGVSRA